MNSMPSLSEISRLLGNHLWQSTLVTFVAGLLTWVLRRNRAQTRYWIWLAALVKFAVPFAVFAVAGERLGSLFLPTRPAHTALPLGIQAASEPFSSGLIRAFANQSIQVGVPNSLSIAVLAIWLIGFTVFLIIGSVRWRRVASIVREATPVVSGRLADALRRVERRTCMPHVSLVASHSRLEPGVFGIFSQVFFGPHGLTDRLDDREFEFRSACQPAPSEWLNRYRPDSA